MSESEWLFSLMWFQWSQQTHEPWVAHAETRINRFWPQEQRNGLCWMSTWVFRGFGVWWKSWGICNGSKYFCGIVADVALVVSAFMLVLDASFVIYNYELPGPSDSEVNRKRERAEKSLQCWWIIQRSSLLKEYFTPKSPFCPHHLASMLTLFLLWNSKGDV